MTALAPEFSRPVSVASLPGRGLTLTIAAEPGELLALAARFGLPSIERLAARLAIRRAGADVALTGTLEAAWHYDCRVTGQPFAASVEEPIAVQLTAEPGAGDGALDLDGPEIEPLEGDGFDAGELVAQAFGALLDPYPRAPDADGRLQALGIETEADAAARRSPFAVLKGGRTD